MLKRTSYAWTSDDEDRLKQLAAQGVYLRNIALRLRRSESSIKTRAHSLGLKLRRTPRIRSS